MSTINDVAKIAGVSRTTVSRYLNKSGYISMKNILNIEKAIIILNYRPNKIAQSLNTRYSGNIALVVGDISNPITANYLKGVEAVSYENKYNLIICDTNFDIEKETNYINMLIDKQVDGIIIAPCEKNKAHIMEVINKGIPIVFITRKMNGIDADYVRFANEDGSFKVVEHLIETGHKRIGIICREIDLKNLSSRLKGYKEALKAYEINFDDRLVFCGDGLEIDGYNGMRYLMNLSSPPTAVYTAVNLQAAGVIRYCMDNDLIIPDDIALASFESFAEFDRIIKPTLTANVMPVFELGATAAQILLSRVSGVNKEPFKEVCLTGVLLIRESTTKNS